MALNLSNWNKYKHQPRTLRTRPVWPHKWILSLQFNCHVTYFTMPWFRHYKFLPLPSAISRLLWEMTGLPVPLVIGQLYKVWQITILNILLNLTFRFKWVRSLSHYHSSEQGSCLRLLDPSVVPTKDSLFFICWLPHPVQTDSKQTKRDTWGTIYNKLRMLWPMVGMSSPWNDTLLWQGKMAFFLHWKISFVTM